MLLHTGTSCGTATVTIKACANADCTALYPGSVTVNLSNVGTWSADPVTFTGGSTDVTLSVGSGTVTLGTTSVSPAVSNATRCYNGATQTCSLTFISSCFDAVESGAGPRTPIYTKIAGSAFSLNVLALSSGTTINTGFTGTVSVDLVNPNAATGNCGDTLAGLTTPVSATFTSANAGRRTVSLTYPNAVKEARVRIISGSQPVCSSDNFSIRPQQFTLSSSTPLNPTSNTIAAGDSFDLTATATTSTNTTASAYSGSPGLNSARIVDHNTVAAGGLVSGGFPASSTGISLASLIYQDVGTLTFQSDAVTDPTFTAVDQVTGTVGTVNHGATGDCVTSSTSNTLASGRYGCTIGSSTFGPIGRFRPDHYAVTVALTPACTAGGFTYMGQPELEVGLSVIARSSSGLSLSRYTSSGAFATSLCNSGSCLATLNVTGDNGGAAISPLNDRFDPDLPSFTWASGAYSVNNTYSFVRQAVPDGPFDDFKLKISVTDIDGVKITSLNGTGITGATGVLSDPTKIRFGRLKLFNAHGSQQLALPIQMRTEYWNGRGFVVNTLDSCTTITASNISLYGYQGALSVANLPFGNIFVGASGGFTSGIGTLRLNKPSPTPTSNGSVNLCVNLGPDTPSTCTGATSADLPWLHGNWTGTSYDDNPAVRATFGIYKGGPVIYIRELH